MILEILGSRAAQRGQHISCVAIGTYYGTYKVEPQGIDWSPKFRPTNPNTAFYRRGLSSSLVDAAINNRNYSAIPIADIGCVPIVGGKSHAKTKCQDILSCTINGTKALDARYANQIFPNF